MTLDVIAAARRRTRRLTAVGVVGVTGVVGPGGGVGSKNPKAWSSPDVSTR